MKHAKASPELYKELSEILSDKTIEWTQRTGAMVRVQEEIKNFKDYSVEEIESSLKLLATYIYPYLQIQVC